MTDTAAVWFFPPGQTTPVHCGRLLVLPAGFIEFRTAGELSRLYAR